MQRVQIDRIIPPNQRTELNMDRTKIDVKLNEIKGIGPKTIEKIKELIAQAIGSE